jgi:hypothetical protein
VLGDTDDREIAKGTQLVPSNGHVSALVRISGATDIVIARTRVSHLG